MLSVPLCARACPCLNFQLFLTHVSPLQIVIATSGSNSHAREVVQGTGLYGSRLRATKERERGKERRGVWNRMVHRGLWNKWSDSLAAILFRLHDKAFKWIKPRRSRGVDVIWLATWFYKIRRRSYCFSLVN